MYVLKVLNSILEASLEVVSDGYQLVEMECLLVEGDVTIFEDIQKVHQSCCSV